MEALVSTVTELSITKPTDFEKVMARVQKESHEVETSLKHEEYTRKIIKEVASVYFFLRKNGLGYTPLSPEEFEIVQKHLLDLAGQKTSRPIARFFSYSWRYFQKNKFFHYSRTPFGKWLNERPFGWDSSLNISDVYESAEKGYVNLSLPPNLKDLVRVIWEKRCQP